MRNRSVLSRSVSYLRWPRRSFPPQSRTNMGKFVALLVIALATVAQGFVKGGYTESNPGSTSVTFVNRGVPSPLVTPSGPTVSLNVNGAHTLAGEVILHHVIYNNNGAPAVNPGVPIGTTGLNRGLTQVIQLHGNGRTHNSGTLAFPPNGAEYLAQYLTPHGHHHDSRRIPDLHISPPGPVFHIDEHRLPGITPGGIYSQPLIFSQQTLKPQLQGQQVLQNQQILQNRPQISQQVQRNQQITQQITQQQQQQQQQRPQAQLQQISQMSQIQQRPASQISGQQISQQHQQNNQMTFQQVTRKPMNELTVLDNAERNGERNGRLPGMPTLAEITSQLSGMNGGSSKTVQMGSA